MKSCSPFPSPRTHNVEWKRFQRACASNKQHRGDIAKAMKNNVHDLFRIFLEENGNISSAIVKFAREQETEKSTTAGKTMAKKREIESRFPDPSKSQQVIAKLTAAGDWMPDEFFPDDVDSRWYLVPDGMKFTDRSVGVIIGRLLCIVGRGGHGRRPGAAGS